MLRLARMIAGSKNTTPNKGGAQLGNTNGAHHRRPFIAQLRKILAQEELTTVECKRSLYLLSKKLIRLALDGEGWAVRELIDRLDGKAVQGVSLLDDEGKAMNIFSPGALRHMTPEKIASMKSLLTEAASEC